MNVVLAILKHGVDRMKLPELDTFEKIGLIVCAMGLESIVIILFLGLFGFG